MVNSATTSATIMVMQQVWQRWQFTLETWKGLLLHRAQQLGLFAKQTHMFKQFTRSRRALSPEERKLHTMRLMRWLALGFVLLVVFGIVGFFGLFAFYSRDLPKPGQVVRRDGFSTKIFDRKGKLLYDLFDTERRNPIVIKDVPENLKHATVAIEDKDFYKHNGFDYMTILRIPYNVVARQRVVGGSTLTQQLVKNVLLTSDRTISRKFKELVLAIQLERTFSKDQILEMYLNEAPYGGTAWGVGTASEVYFNKKVQDLNLVESAVLAGLPQRPSVYSPYSGKKDENGDPYWKVRGRGVLMQMRKNNYLDEAAYQQAMKDIEDLTFQRANSDLNAPHFVFIVIVAPLLLLLITWLCPQLTNNFSWQRRDELFLATLDMLRQHFWLGTGINQSTILLQEYRHSDEIVRFVQPIHNAFWLLLSELGVLGFGLLTNAFGVIKKQKIVLNSWWWLLVPAAALDHYLVSQPIGIFATALLVGLSQANHFPTRK